MNQNAYDKGREAKLTEIREMGWYAARDKFNLENPPGQPYTGSTDGLAYARGENSALVDNIPHDENAGAKTMTATYTTITDAHTAFTNSGVYEFTETEGQDEAVVSDMYRNGKSPEQAVADVLDLDATDRRNIGAE